MKGVFSAPGDYIYFKSQVPLHKISIGSKQWRYYDFGPKVVPPLICLPGTAGTADVHYKQVMSLSMKGYRVISIDIPRIWNHHEWIQAFEKFLDAIDVHHVHLYGTSLGGFLAQLFAQYRPRRVKSLVLSNSFLDTHTFSSAMPWAPVVSWTPSFLLKRYVLTGIRDGPHEPFIADSVDFVVSQVETLKREDLASRLTLTVDHASVGSLLLSDSFITIMDTNDYCAIPQELKDQVSEKYPEARKAYMKTGGDFPFLSRPDEVNLHLQMHLIRVGVEAKPDLVKGFKRDEYSGGPSVKYDGGNTAQNRLTEEVDSLSPPTDQSAPSPADSADSHELDGPPLHLADPFLNTIPQVTSLSPPRDESPPPDILSPPEDKDFLSPPEEQLPPSGSVPEGGSPSALEDQLPPSASDNVESHNIDDRQPICNEDSLLNSMATLTSS